MKSFLNLAMTATALAAVFVSPSTFAQTPLATWTFETSQPLLTNGAAGPFAAESSLGTANATGSHALATTVYSTPAGNGSAHSFSANMWSSNDFYQYTVSTVGYTGIQFIFDQTGSGTGPDKFQIAISTNGGTTFANFGSVYSLPTPAVGWSPGTANATGSTTFTNMFGSLLDNQSSVVIRVVEVSSPTTGSISGGAIGTAGTDRMDNVKIFGNPLIVAPPVISGITPSSSQTVNAGTTATFTLTLSSGDSPLTYFWYKGSALPGNLLPTQTTATLTLSNALAADAGTYTVVVSNASTQTASTTATLAVTDPAINSQPATSQTVLLNSTASIFVGVGGTPTVTYQWFTGTPGNQVQLNDSVGHISGTTSPTLVISNVVAADANFTYFVVAQNGLNSVASQPVSLNVTTTGGPLAFWDFNQPFDPTLPVPSTSGNGLASSTNCIAFVLPNSTPDPFDNADDNNNITLGLGTSTYPDQSTMNTNAGETFAVSTKGAKNIQVTYDLRESSTSSKYHRLQYTTNGVDFINYPASSTFQGTNTTFRTETFNLSGFPGIANNPNFAVRIVIEFESTATYGALNTNSYVGLAGAPSGYGTGGTLSYDLVTISGDAIVGAFNPPVIAPIADKVVPDQTPQTFGLQITGTGPFTITAASLNPTLLPNPTVSGTNITINPTKDNDGVSPVLITVTDGNGNKAVASFQVTTTPDNVAPVITGLVSTNTLVDVPITLNFVVTDDHTPPTGITYTVFSGTSEVVPNNLTITGTGTNRTIVITPVAHQVGEVPITVTAHDNDPTTPKTSSASIILTVIPNTNVVFNDFFDYDGSGGLVSFSGGLWQTHSGTTPNQVAVGGGVATVDGVHFTEDVSALLLGAPYSTNSPTVLYSSFIVKYSVAPTMTGGYFTHLKDLNTGAISGFGARVFGSATNAAPGKFRLGIANGSAGTPISGQLAVDLDTNISYTVVTRFVPATGVSTLWLNPQAETDPSVTATDVPATNTNPINVFAVALRESNSDEGTLTVDNYRIATSFDDVVDVLHITQTGTDLVLTWENASLTLESSTTPTGGYTPVAGAVSPYHTTASGNLFYHLVHLH